MLTADMVVARRRGDELVLAELDADGEARARTIAADLIAIAEGCVGGTRSDVEAAIAAIDVPARDVRTKAALAKLVLDRCTFDAPEDVDPPALREALFTRASAARRALDGGARLDRAAIVAEVAAAHALAPDALESALFADLRGAHRLTAFEPVSDAALVGGFARAQAQAALLRAVRVTVDVRCASAGATRALFHRLKFLRLLYSVERTSEGHRIVIDGPFSLFDSVTKYGLQLAMVLPALDGCDTWSFVADVRWGKERRPLVLRLRGGAREGARPDDDVRLPDDVQALVRAWERLETPWKVRPSAEILDLPGVGLCVPDLVFVRGRTRVHLEVMGYWSRDAVWKRVELVQAGMKTPIVFALSQRLRVSEAVLDADVPAALYVYKGAMSARAVLERVEAVASRAAHAG